jgi:hypothetical protein
MKQGPQQVQQTYWLTVPMRAERRCSLHSKTYVDFIHICHCAFVCVIVCVILENSVDSEQDRTIDVGQMLQFKAMW